jgi:hypothetical protein
METVSPTVFRWKQYRFHFAEYWLEPSVEVARSSGLPADELSALRRVVEERRHDILGAWRNHFAG